MSLALTLKISTNGFMPNRAHNVKYNNIYCSDKKRTTDYTVQPNQHLSFSKNEKQNRKVDSENMPKRIYSKYILVIKSTKAPIKHCYRYRTKKY